MDIEKLKYEAVNKALHIADVSGSTFLNADCFDVFPFIEDKSVLMLLFAICLMELLKTSGIVFYHWINFGKEYKEC
jgi:hypothetical protein